MVSIARRFRWISCWVAAALAFQALALVLQTPMEVARGLGAPAAAADHGGTEGHPAGHHGGPAQRDDACSLCLGMQVTGHGVVPVAPALPVLVSAPEPSAIVAAIKAPALDHRTPQNPRAPPLPV